MSLKYIQEQYNVPAKVGARVKYLGRPGTITGSSGPHIRVLLDGEQISKPYHPTFNIEYLPAERAREAQRLTT